MCDSSLLVFNLWNLNLNGVNGAGHWKPTFCEILTILCKKTEQFHQNVEKNTKNQNIRHIFWCVIDLCKQSSVLISYRHVYLYLISGTWTWMRLIDLIKSLQCVESSSRPSSQLSEWINSITIYSFHKGRDSLTCALCCTRDGADLWRCVEGFRVLFVLL